jgi:hypothetical protein
MSNNRLAQGAEGILIRVLGEIVFRVYHKNGEFTDYDIAHSDMAITITDPDAWFYEDTAVIDHSPQTLGTECEHEFDHNGECLKCDEPIWIIEDK